MRSDPAGRFALFTLGTALLGAVLLSWVTSLLPFGWAWLVAISGVAFLTYGYDKAVAQAVAGSRQTRVPEVVLLGLALCGGTLGAWAGSVVFRHKTKKESFRRRFWTIVGLQVVVLAAYGVWRTAA